jgi:hypothetical protein
MMWKEGPMAMKQKEPTNGALELYD